MFDVLKEDFQQYYRLLPADYGRWRRFVFFLSCQGMWALLDYRFRKWVGRQSPMVKFLLRWPAFFNHVFVETITGISIETAANIGKGLYIGHFCSIFVHGDAVLGEYCSLSHEVTIGLGGKGEKLGVPSVGHHVYFAPGSKVFGKITIGNEVRIGANAVVITSLPDGATAVGVPARVVGISDKYKKKES